MCGVARPACFAAAHGGRISPASLDVPHMHDVSSAEATVRAARRLATHTLVSCKHVCFCRGVREALTQAVVGWREAQEGPAATSCVLRALRAACSMVALVGRAFDSGMQCSSTWPRRTDTQHAAVKDAHVLVAARQSQLGRAHLTEHSNIGSGPHVHLGAKPWTEYVQAGGTHAATGKAQAGRRQRKSHAMHAP